MLKAVAAIETEKYHASGLVLVWLIMLFSSVFGAVQFYLRVPIQESFELPLVLAFLAVSVFCSFKAWSYSSLFKNRARLIEEFNSSRQHLSEVENYGTASELDFEVKAVKSKDNVLLETLLDHRGHYLNDLIDTRFRAELNEQLKQEVKQFEQEYLQKATDLRNQHPLFRAYHALEAAESYLKQRRVEIEKQWNEALNKSSWWNQLMNSGTLNFKDLDKKIDEIGVAKRLLNRKHDYDFEKLEDYYSKLAKQACERIAQTKVSVEKFIHQCSYHDAIGNEPLTKGFFLASLSVPVSLWSDVSRAGEIFDVLRAVNSNYTGMSDIEIWWESIFLPSESLVGLMSLTKGAYLEQLVASDTGGQLFEHFNHPDTDIVIDGVAFQIKATDSVSYIDSVADGIPIIATTEVANLTDAIDSGYSNEDLDGVVDLALGGSVIDFGDTAVDTILSGVGGLGVLASLNGINHAVKKHENGGDPIEAMFEGAGIAIEGTARAAVNTLEAGYKILSSRPSRFVGRGLVKALVVLDNKLTGK